MELPGANSRIVFAALTNVDIRYLSR